MYFWSNTIWIWENIFEKLLFSIKYTKDKNVNKNRLRLYIAKTVTGLKHERKCKCSIELENRLFEIGNLNWKYTNWIGNKKCPAQRTHQWRLFLCAQEICCASFVYLSNEIRHSLSPVQLLIFLLFKTHFLHLFVSIFIEYMVYVNNKNN